MRFALYGFTGLLLLNGPVLADVLTVTFDGTGDFLDVQSAVAASAPGDTILVRSGSYIGSLVIDKELTIFGLPNLLGVGAMVDDIRVENIPEGSQVILADLQLQGVDAAGLTIANCEGAVRIQNCRTFGDVSGSFAGGIVQNSSDVIFKGSRCKGSQNQPGLLMQSSRVASYQSNFVGGFPGAPAGAVVELGFFFATGTLFRGGSGGSGMGGDALVIFAGSEVELLDNVYEPGPGTPPGFTINGPANILSGVQRFVLVDSIGFSQTPVELAISGEPGSLVLFLISRTSGFHYYPMRQGVLGLGVPLLVAQQPLGTIPASGVLRVAYQLPPLPLNVPEFEVHVQGFTISPSGVNSFASPAVLVTINCMEDGDCDADGMPDVCAIQAGMVADTNDNFVPDSCEVDCNGNGIDDNVETFLYPSSDQNGNGIPDNCPGG